jgi:hypothetical protein
MWPEFGLVGLFLIFSHMQNHCNQCIECTGMHHHGTNQGWKVTPGTNHSYTNKFRLYLTVIIPSRPTGI